MQRIFKYGLSFGTGFSLGIYDRNKNTFMIFARHTRNIQDKIAKAEEVVVDEYKDVRDKLSDTLDKTNKALVNIGDTSIVNKGKELVQDIKHSWTDNNDFGPTVHDYTKDVGSSSNRKNRTIVDMLHEMIDENNKLKLNGSNNTDAHALEAVNKPWNESTQTFNAFSTPSSNQDLSSNINKQPPQRHPADNQNTEEGFYQTVSDNLAYAGQSVKENKATKYVIDTMEEVSENLHNPKHMPKNDRGEYDESLRQPHENYTDDAGIIERTKDVVASSIQAVGDSKAVKIMADTIEATKDYLMNPSHKPKIETNTDMSMIEKTTGTAADVNDKVSSSSINNQTDRMQHPSYNSMFDSNTRTPVTKSSNMSNKTSHGSTIHITHDQDYNHDYDQSLLDFNNNATAPLIVLSDILNYQPGLRDEVLDTRRNNYRDVDDAKHS